MPSCTFFNPVCSAPLSLSGCIDVLAVQAEMRAQSIVIEAVEARAQMHVGVLGGTVGVVMDVALLHRHVALVVEDHDQDRQIVLL